MTDRLSKIRERLVNGYDLRKAPGDLEYLSEQLAIRDKMLEVAEGALYWITKSRSVRLEPSQHRAEEALSTLRSMRENK